MKLRFSRLSSRHDERPILDPGFQQGADLGPVGLVRDVQAHGGRDGVAGPFLRLAIFLPAAGRDSDADGTKIGGRDAIERVRPSPAGDDADAVAVAELDRRVGTIWTCRPAGPCWPFRSERGKRSACSRRLLEQLRLQSCRSTSAPIGPWRASRIRRAHPRRRPRCRQSCERDARARSLSS